MVLEDGDQGPDVSWVTDHAELSCWEVFPREDTFSPLTREENWEDNVHQTELDTVNALSTISYSQKPIVFWRPLDHTPFLLHSLAI